MQQALICIDSIEGLGILGIEAANAKIQQSPFSKLVDMCTIVAHRTRQVALARIGK